MTWKISNTHIDPDPYYGAVSLLLHGDGTDGSTNITDSSLSPKTVTAFGNAQISTAQSKFGGSSLAFDGSGDYLVTPYSRTMFDWWVSDFTVEAWVYANSWSGWASVSGPAMIAHGTASAHIAYWSFGPVATGKLAFRWFDGSARYFETSGLIPLSSWNHIAMTRTSSGFRFFINGIDSDGLRPWTNSGQSSETHVLNVGALNNAFINGYIDDLRITKGVARYTSNFTPPTRAFPNF